MSHFEQAVGILERLVASLVFGVVGLLVGVVVRFFALPTQFSSLAELMAIYMPWMIGSALILGMFGWFYPKIGTFLIEVIAG